MDLFPRIAAQRREVADLLETLTDDEWATPSLCGAWTVRGVATHLTMPFEVSLLQVAGRMVRARGDFNRMSEGYVISEADKATSDIVASLRSHAESHFTPPGFGAEAPLTDIVVHGLDIGVPLAKEPAIAEADADAVLTFLVSPKATRGFVAKGRLAGLRFRSTDTDWSAGDGPLVEGPARYLVLAMAGRNAGLDRLDGEGLATLSARSR